MPQDVPGKPEEQELALKRQELAALEAELKEREEELADVQGAIFDFERRSKAELDPRYEELADLYQKIGELTARLPKPQSAPPADPPKAPPPPHRKKNQQRSVPPPPKRVRPDPKDDTPINPADTLKRLYRDVAKLVHPDLAEDDGERQHRHHLMTQANEAYDAGDEARLAGIMHEWESSPEAVRGDGIAAELIRTIRKLYRAKLRLAVIATEMNRIQQTSLYNLMTMADAADDFERDLLAEMAGRLDEDIAQAKARVAELEKRVPPEPTPPSDQASLPV